MELSIIDTCVDGGLRPRKGGLGFLEGYKCLSAVLLAMLLLPWSTHSPRSDTDSSVPSLPQLPTT